MAFELRPGQGTLFQNDQKGNDKAPTHRGELCLADGSIIKIAGWRKEGRNGPFLSLSIDKPRESQDERFPSGTDRSVSGGGRDPARENLVRGLDRIVAGELDDEIPF